MPHLLVAVSSHGFGHLAQVAPVLNRLRSVLPELKLTLRTTLPRPLLAQRIHGEFAIQAAADDFGMLQHTALEVDLDASLRRYRALHAEWPRQVARVASELEALAPDLLLADVPYLTLAAARHCGIPSIALCSLNWLAILQGYLPQEHDAQTILQQMHDGYASAACFLCPAPSMPMPGLDNLQEIGVVASPGIDRRAELITRGFIDEGERLAVLAMGGIDHRLSIEQWPVIPGMRYGVPAAWQVSQSNCFDIERSGMGFSDLLASADLVITKPGYGTVTEAAVVGVPVLYVRRGDWPEEPALVEWMEANAVCREIPRDALERGTIRDAVEALLSRPRSQPITCSGSDEAASVLFGYLCGDAQS